MKTICFYFQIHQPFRLKRYRFFDIGNDHYYYDDFQNEEIIHRIAEQCYLPANRTILEMIKTSGGKFKVAFSISGVALEQMEIYTPEVIDSFKELAATGNVEFLSETYAHSLSSLGDPEEFKHQVKKQEDKIKTLFGVKPKVFRNTELIYSDDISAMVSEMGYKGMLTEGAKHILGWKSPNYMYSSCVAPKLSLLLKNDRFSEDLSNRFSDYSWNEYPLTADKYMSWIAATPDSEQIINLFMNYEVLGSLHPASTGIFEFFKALPRFAADKGISFSTPSEVFTLIKPVDSISVPYPISWVDEERDCSSWLGNVLQQEAFRKINEIGERVRLSQTRRIRQDWYYLQSSDHFYYMSTKHMGQGGFSPYDNPYDAFNNYMNVLSDFIVRVNAEFPENIENEELNSLLSTIKNQGEEIESLQKELDKLILELKKEEKVPRLLLHSCCAPCSSYVLEYLSQYFEVTVFYYNPNIYPESEYTKRVLEQQKLISEMRFKHPVTFIAGNYDSEKFYNMARGLENVKEGGERCFKCYELRLREAAKIAKNGEYDFFTTTLSISPLKNAQKLNEIGMLLAEEYGIEYLLSDFKKKNGYKRSVELSEQYGLYRQDYCGCVFSMRERKEAENKNKK